MAHYRKIDTRITLDRKFNALPKDSKLIFFHLLTHRYLTSLGAMYITLPGLACELGFTVEEMDQPFRILCEQGMVQHDRSSHFLWLPQFLKYNAPESPNAVRAWENALYYLPECDLRDAVIAHAIQFVQTLAPTFQDALPEVFHSLNQPLSNLPANPAEGMAVSLPEGLANPGSIPDEDLMPPLRQGYRQGLPIQRTITNNNNKEQIAITNNKKQEEKKIVQENNSEEKNNIGEKENIVAKTRQKIAKPPDSDILWVFEYWQQTLGHLQAQLDPKRRKVIKNALASGYSVTQLQNAIRGCSLTPHNMGENEQGQRYDGLHVILRDADQIDRFIRNSHSPPRRRTTADQLFADNLAAGDRWLEKKYQQAEKVIHATE